jgi:hypothetical protein
MLIKVGVVIWYNESTKEWELYCPAINAYIHDIDSALAIRFMKEEEFIWRLEERFNCVNLQQDGWIITENSTIAPVYSDEKLIQLTEEFIGRTLLNSKIIILETELPEPKPPKSIIPYTP